MGVCVCMCVHACVCGTERTLKQSHLRTHSQLKFRILDDASLTTDLQTQANT